MSSATNIGSKKSEEAGGSAGQAPNYFPRRMIMSPVENMGDRGSGGGATRAIATDSGREPAAIIKETRHAARRDYFFHGFL